MSQPLIADFMLPEVGPSEPDEPRPDVAYYRLATTPIVLEIYRRPGNRIGWRYQAWVAWRDADDTVCAHGWHEIEPQPLVTDSLEEAKLSAEKHASSCGIEFRRPWDEASLT